MTQTVSLGYFWLYHFKRRFILVWYEIHWSKIPPVKSWQLTNRTASDISRHSRHSICWSFFPVWIYNTIQIHSGETSPPQDFVGLLSRCTTLMHWSSLLRNYERSTYSKSSSRHQQPGVWSGSWDMLQFAGHLTYIFLLWGDWRWEYAFLS